VVPLFVLGHFSHHVLTSITTPLLPFIRNDFNLDYTQTGVVSSAFMLAYGLGHLPAGWLADRCEPRTLMTVGISGVALAGILISFSQSYQILVMILILMGLLAGGYHPSAPPLISGAVPREHLGRALGFHNIGGGASHLVTPLLAVSIAQAWGWPSSFLFLAVPTLFFGLLFYLLVGITTPGGKERRHADLRDDQHPLGRRERLRHLTVFLLLITITGAIINSGITFLPLLFVDHFGLGKTLAALLLSLLYLAVFWAGPLGGNLADRKGSIQMALLFTLGMGPVIFFLPQAPGIPALVVMLLILGALVFSRMSAAEAYIIQTAPPDTRATVLGIYFFGGMEGGAVATPLLGYVIDHYGFGIAYGLAGLVALVATAVLGYWLRKHQPPTTGARRRTYEDK
jgi:MFS family permease